MLWNSHLGNWEWLELEKILVYYSLTYISGTGLCLLNNARIVILKQQPDYATFMVR